MGLQKSFNLANGSTGNYIRVGTYVWDRDTRHVSVPLKLYTSKAYADAAPADPLTVIAKLRLDGDKFDQYVSNPVLDGDTVTLVGQLYTASKAEPLLAGAGFAAVDLSDAVNV